MNSTFHHRDYRTANHGHQQGNHFDSDGAIRHPFGPFKCLSYMTLYQRRDIRWTLDSIQIRPLKNHEYGSKHPGVFYLSFLFFLKQLIWGPRQEEREVSERNTDEDSAERTGAGGDR